MLQLLVAVYDRHFLQSQSVFEPFRCLEPRGNLYAAQVARHRRILPHLPAFWPGLNPLLLLERLILYS